MEEPFDRHIPEGLLERYAVPGSLPDAELVSREKHLLLCPACQDRLKELDAFIAAMRLALQKRVNPAGRGSKTPRPHPARGRHDLPSGRAAS